MPSPKRTHAELIPTIADLLDEARHLLERLHALRAEHYPANDSFDPENIPIRYPLALRWRPVCGDYTVRPKMVAEVIEWVRAFRSHMTRVDRYFLVVHEKPHIHRRFRFGLFDERYQDFELLGIDDCLAYLQDDEELLAIEAFKQREVIPRTLPAMLKAKRRKLHLSQEKCAEMLDVPVDTFKSWEAARHLPVGEHERKVRKFLAEETARKSPRKARKS